MSILLKTNAPEGNAILIVSRVVDMLTRVRVSSSRISKYQEDAYSSDFNALIALSENILTHYNVNWHHAEE